jgi:hypothetical protein
MAGQKAKRRSRKAHRAPRAVQSQRRVQRAAQQTQQRQTTAAAGRTLGTHGERPGSLFGPIPVSEIAIFAGIVGLIVGIINGGGPALAVGAIVCALGVFEVTAREHFTGYRSHTTLLAAFPAVVVEVLLAEFVGVPRTRILLLLPVIPVFGLSFWLLRRNFRLARHARVTRPPSA